MDPQIVQDFVSAINDHNVDKICSLMANGHTFIDSHGNEIVGTESMRAGWIGYFQLFPDYKIEITEIFSNGDTVAAFGFASGTFEGRRESQDNYWRLPAAWRAITHGIAAGTCAQKDTTRQRTRFTSSTWLPTVKSLRAKPPGQHTISRKVIATDLVVLRLFMPLERSSITLSTQPSSTISRRSLSSRPGCSRHSEYYNDSFSTSNTRRTPYTFRLPNKSLQPVTLQCFWMASESGQQRSIMIGVT